MVGLFDIKPETFFYHIWPAVDFNDLLRVRRVSHHGRSLINDYLRSNPNRVPELEITENGERNMGQFLKMGLPVTKLFINNWQSGVDFYEKWNTSMCDFLELYGTIVTHLRVHDLGLFPMIWECDFLSGLVNLESITAHNWVRTDFQMENRKEMLTDSYLEHVSSNMLAVYTRLKNFDVGIDDVHNAPEKVFEELSTVNLDIFCDARWPRLESIALPSTHFNQDVIRIVNHPWFTSVPNGGPFPYEALIQSYSFDFLLPSMIMPDAYDLRPDLSKLKRISFAHFHFIDETKIQHMFEFVSKSFLFFAAALIQNQIRLEMVNSAWFYSIRTLENLDYGSTIVSLIDLHPAVITYVSLDNLEQLSISSSRSCVLTMPENIYPDGDGYINAREQFKLGERPEWSLLKSILISVDSTLMGVRGVNERRVVLEPESIAFTQFYPPHSVAHLFSFLFCGKPFPNLTELVLNFKEIPGIHVVSNAVTENIARCCGNVTKLELTNWTGTNKGITKLWEGLTQLHEVVIRRCKNIGNVAFVGDNIANPLFVGLKNLRKVSLLELDKMPKLTDTMFRLVLSKMKLSHLILSSEQPLDTITVDGVRSLLSGPFKDSIAKFPFKNWSVAGCTTEAFAQIEKEFRSYQIL